MTDETPENETDLIDEPGDPEEETTETVEDDSSVDSSEIRRPYISYSASARRGSIWNSPLGLFAAGVLISKGMDLAYRAFIEREKTTRMQYQQEQ